MNAEQASSWLWDMSRKAASEAHRLYCEDLFQPVYLAYGLGRVAATRHPEGLALASGERMPRNVTIEQATAWAHHLLRICPCLPPETT